MSGPWRHRAACNGHDTAYWFPDTTGPRQPSTDRAIAICRTCLVQLDCLRHALERPEIHGIWGGKTERERFGMRRPSSLIDHGTNSGYMAHHARGEEACRACKDAHNAYQAAKRRIRERAATRDQIEEIRE